MAETKKPNTAEPTAKKKPSVAALQTALAQQKASVSVFPDNHPADAFGPVCLIIVLFILSER